MILFFKKHLSPCLFFLVVGIGVFFRLYRFPSIPYGLNNDAAWEGSAAIDMLRGNIWQYVPYAAEGWRGEPIVRLLLAGCMLLWGNHPYLIRLITIVFGIALLVVCYFFIKLLFDTQKALLTSFFIATSGWHITMSKTGWRAITVPFFSVAFFYILFLGIRHKKSWYFVIAGILLSIGSFYTYDAGRILFFFFIVYFVLFALSKRHIVKQYRKQFFILLLVCAICTIPIVQYAYGNWINFTGRSNFLFVGHQIEQTHSLAPLGDNLITTALLFNVNANGNDFFISQPLLDEPALFLFPLGLIIATITMVKRKDKATAFMLLFLFMNLIPGVLSDPNGNRVIGTVPAVYFFCGLGVLGCIWLLQYIIHWQKKIISTLFVMLLCSYTIFITFTNYIGPHREELPGFYPETLITTNYIKTIWDSYNIYLTDNFPRELLTYYLYQSNHPAFYPNYDWIASSSSFTAIAHSTYTCSGADVCGDVETRAKGKAFFMLPSPENENVVHQLINTYPNAKKMYLWYNDDTIHRPASIVVLIPPT